MTIFVLSTAISVDASDERQAEAGLGGALDNVVGGDLASYEILQSRQHNDEVAVVTVAISVDADEESAAEQCLDGALQNLVGGDIRSYELLEMRAHDRDATGEVA